MLTYDPERRRHIAWVESAGGGRVAANAETSALLVAFLRACGVNPFVMIGGNDD